MLQQTGSATRFGPSMPGICNLYILVLYDFTTNAQHCLLVCIQYTYMSFYHVWARRQRIHSCCGVGCTNCVQSHSMIVSVWSGWLLLGTRQFMLSCILSACLPLNIACDAGSWISVVAIHRVAALAKRCSSCW